MDESFDSEKSKLWPPITDELEGSENMNWSEFMDKFKSDNINIPIGNFVTTEPIEYDNWSFAKKLWADEVTSTAAGKIVTVNLAKSGIYIKGEPFFKIGQLIRFAETKRIWGEVIEATTDGCSLNKVYRPSPKSTLNNKSIFSKKKIKIVKLKK